MSPAPSHTVLSLQETKKVVKRSNSQMRHKSDAKPSVVLRNGEFFEQIDSGWTSRDSSSMDRSSSVSLEEKMDELELGKMRKTVDMRSEMNLTSQQFVGFGMLHDQVYNKAVRKGFEFSLMVVGKKGQLIVNRSLCNSYDQFQEPLVWENLLL